MATLVNSSAVTIGSTRGLISALFPDFNKSDKTINETAVTRFGTEWQQALELSGTDQDGKEIAVEYLQKKGIIRALKNGQFSAEDKTELDQHRMAIGWPDKLIEDFVGIVANGYFSAQAAFPEPFAIAEAMTIESENTATEIEAIMSEINDDALVLPENVVHTDSEGAVSAIEDLVVIDATDLEIKEQATVEVVADAVFSEAETSATAEPVATNQYEQYFNEEVVQDPVVPVADIETSVEATAAPDLDGNRVVEMRDAALDVIPEPTSEADAITSNEIPALVDAGGGASAVVVNDAAILAERIDKIENVYCDVFMSPILAVTRQEIETEINVAINFDYPELKALSVEPSEGLLYAQMERVEKLQTALKDLENAELEAEIAEEAARIAAETATEPVVENVAPIIEIVEEPVVEAVAAEIPEKVELEAWQKAKFASKEAWIASFAKKPIPTKVVNIDGSTPQLKELNVGGKYTKGKAKGNAPKAVADMTEREQSIAARNKYKESKKHAKNFRSIAAVKAGLSGIGYEPAKLNSFKVGETISVFPASLSPNVKPDYGTKKNGARRFDYESVGIGSAFTADEKGNALALGLHWKNLPTSGKGDSAIPAFIWPDTAILMKFEAKTGYQKTLPNGKVERVTEWYKSSALIAVPMILDCQFGHFDQPLKGMMPTTVLNDHNPICRKPTIVVGTNQNLVNMGNLGFKYLGTSEIPKGKKYMNSGIIGMPVHIFLNPKGVAKRLSEWIAEDAILNAKLG